MMKQKIMFLFISLFLSITLFSSASAAESPATVGKRGGEGTDSRSSTCDDFSEDSKKNDCEEAWDKARGTKEGKEYAKNSINDNKERRKDCGDDRKPSRSFYCRSAYDTTLKKKAAELGATKGEEEATNDSKDAKSTCKDAVKFGKDVYKGPASKECEKSYKKARANGEKDSENKCGDINTYFNFGDLCKGNSDKGGSDNPIYGILITTVNILAGLVSLAVVGGILYGAFLYTTARDNSQQTQKGIQVITDAVIALILFFLLYAVINFLVPGGLFS